MSIPELQNLIRIFTSCCTIKTAIFRYDEYHFGEIHVTYNQQIY